MFVSATNKNVISLGVEFVVCSLSIANWQRPRVLCTCGRLRQMRLNSNKQQLLRKTKLLHTDELSTSMGYLGVFCIFMPLVLIDADVGNAQTPLANRRTGTAKSSYSMPHCGWNLLACNDWYFHRKCKGWPSRHHSASSFANKQLGCRFCSSTIHRFFAS